MYSPDRTPHLHNTIFQRAGAGAVGKRLARKGIWLEPIVTYPYHLYCYEQWEHYRPVVVIIEEKKLENKKLEKLNI